MDGISVKYIEVFNIVIIKVPLTDFCINDNIEQYNSSVASMLSKVIILPAKCCWYFVEVKL